MKLRNFALGLSLLGMMLFTSQTGANAQSFTPSVCHGGTSSLVGDPHSHSVKALVNPGDNGAAGVEFIHAPQHFHTFEVDVVGNRGDFSPCSVFLCGTAFCAAEHEGSTTEPANHHVFFFDGCSDLVDRHDIDSDGKHFTFHIPADDDVTECQILHIFCGVDGPSDTRLTLSNFFFDAHPFATGIFHPASDNLCVCGFSKGD